MLARSLCVRSTSKKPVEDERTNERTLLDLKPEAGRQCLFEASNVERDGLTD